LAASSISQSSSTMATPFPPSSRCNFLSPAVFARCWPTSVEPVKLTRCTRGSETIASPT